MPRPARLTPVELSPAPWPDRASDDASAEIARQFVVNLRDAMNGRPLRVVAELAGVSHVALMKILHGRVWPDLATISRLEIGLRAELYSSKDVWGADDPR